MKAMITILIVDDHDLVREGIRARLALADNIEVCGEAANGTEAISRTKSLNPDVVFLDISMPDMTGLEAAKRIIAETPDIKVLFLTMHDNPEYVREALRIGAKGFLLKDVSREEMMAAVEAVYHGGLYLSAKIAGALSGAAQPVGEEPDPYSLTRREREVLRRIADGATNKDIADQLDISVRTVESHRFAIRTKTNANSAGDLYRIADELGLTENLGP